MDMVKERSTKLEARKKELAGFLDGTEEPPPLLHPNLAKYYHEEIAAVHDQLGTKKREHMLPTNSERCSAASISCPMVRNW